MGKIQLFVEGTGDYYDIKIKMTKLEKQDQLKANVALVDAEKLWPNE